MSWPKVPMGEIVVMRTGKLDSNAAVEDGEFPFFTCSQQTLRINKPAFDTKAVLLGGNNAAGIYPLKYYEGEFNAYQRTYVIETIDPNVLNIRFLFYSLKPALSHFQSVSIGAATQYLTKGILDNFKISLPSLRAQDRIASILSTYNDLIENNRRRIQLLEQAARLLYKEWFVHLRFPGHEHTKIHKGIPEGWERKKLSDLTFVVTKGTTPTTLGKTFVEEGVNFIKVESIDNSGKIVKEKMARIDEETHELLKRSQLLEGDILFSIAGAIGRSAIVPKWVTPANTNQALAIIRPMNHETRHYLYWVVRSDSFLAYSMGRVVQTAQANVSLSALKSALITIPTEKIIKLFVEIVTPIHQQIDGLNSEVRLASEARDLLLPRLMNGELIF